MFICDKNQFYIDNFEKKYCDYLFEYILLRLAQFLDQSV